MTRATSLLTRPAAKPINQQAPAATQLLRVRVVAIAGRVATLQVERPGTLQPVARVQVALHDALTVQVRWPDVPASVTAKGMITVNDRWVG